MVFESNAAPGSHDQAGRGTGIEWLCSHSRILNGYIAIQIPDSGTARFIGFSEMCKKLVR